MKYVIFFFLMALSINASAASYNFESFVFAQNSTSIDTETAGLGIGFDLNLTDKFTINAFIAPSDANLRGLGVIYNIGNIGLGAASVLHRMQSDTNNGYMYFMEYKTSNIFARIGMLDISHSFSSNVCNVGALGSCVTTDVVITESRDNSPFVMIGVEF